MKELISVIIPVYNTKKYINRCVDSVIDQIYKNIEILIIDDGSTDGSEKLCDEYLNKDSRIMVIHKKNEGQGVARNVGMDLANGSIIAFVDSDDWIETTYLLDLYSKMHEDNLDCVICSYKYVDEEGIDLAYTVYDLPYVNIEAQECLRFFLKNSGIEGYVWNKLWKKDLLIKNNIEFPNKLKYEDIVFTFKALSICPNIGFVNKKIYNYRQRDSSTVHKLCYQNVCDYLTVVSEIYEFAANLHMSCEGKYYKEFRYITTTYGFIRQINKYDDLDKKKIIKLLSIEIQSSDIINMLYYLLNSNFGLRDKCIGLLKIILIKLFFLLRGRKIE